MRGLRKLTKEVLYESDKKRRKVEAQVRSYTTNIFGYSFNLLKYFVSIRYNKVKFVNKKI